MTTRSKKKNKSEPFSEEERAQLVLEYRTKARKLSRSILRKWHARLDIEEVDSIVDLSLCEAVKRFDPDKGASFMTFMYFHLRGNLIRAVSEAITGNGVVIDDEDDSVRAVAAAQGKNAPRGAPRVAYASEVADVMYSQENQSPDKIVLKKQYAKITEEARMKLDPLEQEVISRIFLKEQQLLDIAHSLGYSRCHISRVKKRALETLYGELVESVGDSVGITKPLTTTPEKRKSRRRRQLPVTDEDSEVVAV